MKKLLEVNWKKAIVFFVYIILLVLLLIYRINHEEIAEYITETPQSNSVLLENNYKNTEYKQYFTLEKNSSLRFVSIQFATYGDMLQTKGLIFSCYTEDGMPVCVTEIKQEDLQDNQYYYVNIDSEVVSKNGRYYFTLEGMDEEEDSCMTAAIWGSKEGHEGDYLLVNGEKQDFTINAVYKCMVVDYTAYIYLGLQFLGALLLFLFTFREIEKKGFYIFMNILVFLVNFVILEWAITKVGLSGIEMVWQARCMTYVLVLAVQMILFALSGVNVYLSILLTDLVFIIFSLVNYFVMVYRGVPVVPSDLFALKTLSTVVESYDITFTYRQLLIFMWLLLYFALLIRLMLHDKYHLRWKMSKSVILRKGITILLSFAAGAVAFVWLCNPEVLKRSGVEAYIWDRNGGYYANGPVMNFMANMQYATIRKPENYSKELVEQYLAEYKNTGKKDTTDEQPNIILIMNESLADFDSYETNSIQFSQDPLPFLHRLTKNTIKGNCYMSIFGSGTSNSELEALTSHSAAFFPTGSIVYQQFPQEKIQGLASELGEQGYTRIAMHPCSATNWNRSDIYKAMGFETFYSERDFGDAEWVRWISDRATYDKIIELYEQKAEGEKLFIFDVTMQGHGGYDTNTSWETEIMVENGDYPYAKEYLSSTYVSDRAFEYLVEYFQDVDEPTLIFMFGDHQPSLETEFFESLLGKSMTDLTLEEVQKKYVTPYVLWTNYEIDAELGKDISANQISTLIKENANIKLTSYDRFIQEFHKTISVINANGYRDMDGNWYEYDEESDYTELVNKYRMIQYGIYCDGIEAD